MSNQSATYQARVAVTPEVESFLSGYANHYNHVERTLYADMQRQKKAAAAFKNDYLIKFSLTARQFNAVGRNLEGKISSVLELLLLRKQELQLKLEKETKALAKLDGKIKAAREKGTDCNKLKFAKHQKNRRIGILKNKLDAVIAQEATNDARICFGSRSLFRKQFNLEINGYANHSEWQQDWTAKRNSQFYVLGSGDEETGCQGCTISENPDGTFNLQLRSLSKEAKYLTLSNVTFKYGAEAIRGAIANNIAAKAARNGRSKQLRLVKKDLDSEISVDPAILGQALSYRFIKDVKGWRVMITTDMPKLKRYSVEGDGYLGLDINSDCIALAETNRHGNLLKSKILPLVTYGKSTDQAEALICEVAKQIVDYAVLTKKPICMERLDFKKKKATIAKDNPKQARMLSSLSYNKIIQAVKARAYRFGIVVKQVNPAYTSIIGLINYTKKLGISVHQAAAFAVARRGSGYRELPITGEDACIPTSKGDHVAFRLPVRKTLKHLCNFWSAVRLSTRAVLAAHFRPPQGEPLLSVARKAKSKVPIFTVRPRNVNRPQNCSAGVIDDIPW